MLPREAGFPNVYSLKTCVSLFWDPTSAFSRADPASPPAPKTRKMWSPTFWQVNTVTTVTTYSPTNEARALKAGKAGSYQRHIMRHPRAFKKGHVNNYLGWEASMHWALCGE